MPIIDLAGILGPVVETVASMVFPSTVSIEAPVRTQDATGDATTAYEVVDAGVPALIEPANSRETSGVFGGVTILATDVLITLAGDRYIEQDYRILVEDIPPDDPDPRTGDRWDVVGVARDPARVTTTILGRSRTPGTPDEDGS